MQTVRQADRRIRRIRRLERLAAAFVRIHQAEDRTAAIEARRWLRRVTERIVGRLKQSRTVPGAGDLMILAAPEEEFQRFFRPRLLHLVNVGFKFESDHINEPRQQSFMGIAQRLELDAKDPFDLSMDMDPAQLQRLRTWLGSRQVGVWGQVSGTTQKTLAKTLAKGMEKGLTGPALAREVQGVLSGYSTVAAKRLARTEVTGAMNFGEQLAREELEVELKSWASTIDRRTRTYATGKADHLGPHGQVVPNDKPFIVSGQRLMHPGDSQLGASAYNVVNCRCVAVAEFDDTAVPVVIDPGIVGPIILPDTPIGPQPKPDKVKPPPKPKPVVVPVVKLPVPTPVAPKPAVVVKVASPVPDIIDPKDWAPPPMPTFPAGDSQKYLIEYAANQRSAEALARINEYRTTMRALEPELEAMRLKLLGELEPLQAKIRAAEAVADRLSAQGVEISARLFGPKKGQAAAQIELDALKQQIAVARQAVKDAIADADKELASFRSRVGSLLGNPNRQFFVDDSASRTQITQDARRQTQQFYRQMHRSQHTSLRGQDMIRTVDKGGREHYDHLDINVGARSSSDVIIHEIGHAVEDANKIGNLSSGMVHSRVQFEVPKHLGGGLPQHLAEYKPEEVAAEDEFAKGFAGRVLSKSGQKSSGAYMGKLYGSGNTEVIALGFQQFFLDPYGFLASDPEFARYILSVYTGRVGKYAVPPVVP